VNQWHPATKLLVLAALLVLPYLLWTGSGDEAPAVAASVARPVAGEADPVTVEPPPTPFMLPPLERFTAVVERPLFSPTRRMPPPPPLEEAPTTDLPEVEAPVDQGPAEPDLRFFGTVRQAGTAAALVTYPATAEVARLRPGDAVGDWQVISVERNRLELGLGEERRSFEIFGAGMRGTPSETPPAAAQPPAPPRWVPPPGGMPEDEAVYDEDTVYPE
jgi:general secretion pathway protein N